MDGQDARASTLTGNARKKSEERNFVFQVCNQGTLLLPLLLLSLDFTFRRILDLQKKRIDGRVSYTTPLPHIVLPVISHIIQLLNYSIDTLLMIVCRSLRFP